MKIYRLGVKNFRGIQTATVVLPNHAVLIGDNNTGKTTILEAIDLALGPDRLNRMPPIDEHDFFQGRYTAEASTPADGDAPTAKGGDNAKVDSGEDGETEAPKIKVEVTIGEQKGRFGDYWSFGIQPRTASMTSPTLQA